MHRSCHLQVDISIASKRVASDGQQSLTSSNQLCHKSSALVGQNARACRYRWECSESLLTCLLPELSEAACAPEHEHKAIKDFERGYLRTAGLQHGFVV